MSWEMNQQICKDHFTQGFKVDFTFLNSALIESSNYNIIILYPVLIGWVSLSGNVN